MSIYKYQIEFELYPDPMGLDNVDQRSFEVFCQTPYFEPKGDQAVVVDELGHICITHKKNAKGLRKLNYFIDINDPDNLEQFNKFYDLINLNLSEEEIDEWSLELENPDYGIEYLVACPFGINDYRFALNNMREIAYELKEDKCLNLFLNSFDPSDYEPEINDKFIIRIKIEDLDNTNIDPKAINSYRHIPQFNPKEGYVTVMDQNGLISVRKKTETAGLDTRFFCVDLSGYLSQRSFNQIPYLFRPGSKQIKEEWFLPVFEKRKNGCIDKIVLVPNLNEGHDFAFGDMMGKIHECRPFVDSIINDQQYIAFDQNPDLLP